MEDKNFDELVDILKNRSREVERELKDWWILIKELKLSVPTEETRKTEQYAWAAVQNVLAHQRDETGKDFWIIVEKALRIVRHIILS